jgi:uncharacterized FAD-dependent dehydrogenase
MKTKFAVLGKDNNKILGCNAITQEMIDFVKKNPTNSSIIQKFKGGYKYIKIVN